MTEYSLKLSMPGERQFCSVGCRSHPWGALAQTSIKPTFSSAAGAPMCLGEWWGGGQSHWHPGVSRSKRPALPKLNTPIAANPMKSMIRPIQAPWIIKDGLHNHR